MSPKDANAVKKSKQPDDFYDQLGQDAKDIWDEIGSLGYTPEKGSAGMWWARKTQSKHAASVGPCESLPALLAGVKDEIAEEAKYPKKESNVVDMQTNGRVKQPYLPGAEDIEELDTQADVCLKAQDDQQLAKSNFSEAKDLMKELLKQHGRTNYKRGGWNMTIKNNEILELKQDKNRGNKSDQPLEADPDSEAANVVDPQD